MAMDISVVRDLATFFASWQESEAEYFTYMPRYTKDNSPLGRCVRCYDNTTGQITDASCPVCYGTGFTGGYADPVTGPNAPTGKVLATLNANSIVTDWQISGIVRTEEDQKVYLQLKDSPAISDILIDPEGNRYRIGTHITDWNYRGVQFGYEAVVFQQSPDNIIYTVPVPVIPYVAGASSPFTEVDLVRNYICITQTEQLA